METIRSASSLDPEFRAVNAVPVVGLLRGDDYLAACQSIVMRDGRGVCLRIQREDFVDFPDLRTRIEEVMRSVDLGPESADVVLDLRALNPAERDMNATRVAGLIKKIPWLNRWRSLTFAATSFPQNLTGIPPADGTFIERNEWQLWIDTAALTSRIGRVPIFGDYAISHPEPAEVDPRIMRPSASVRYTCDGAWLVLKARNLRDHGYGQFHEVCRDLIARPEYRGPDFSWGDRYVADCAAELVGTGNLTTWRKAEYIASYCNGCE